MRGRICWKAGAAAAAALILSTGCGQSGGSSDQKGKVAVVDLEQVAEALGREGVLVAYASGTARPQGQGPGAPDEQTAAVAPDEDQQQRQMRSNLMRNFRAEVRPAARRVAQQEGMSIVLIKHDDVVLYTGRVNDLTEKVIDQLQGQAGGGAGGGGASGGGGSGDGGGGDGGSGDGGSGDGGGGDSGDG